MVHPAVPAWVRRVPLVGGIAAVCVALLGLVGWLFDVRILTTVLPNHPSIKLNASVSLLASGTYLALLRSPGRRMQRLRLALALVPACIGVLTSVEWATGTSLRIDQFLHSGASLAQLTGRPAPYTAAALVAFGLAATAACGESRIAYRAHVAACLAYFVIVGSVALGYLYDARLLTDSGRSTGVSLVTLIGLLALEAGLLARLSETSALLWIWDESLSGAMVRRLVPVCFGLPPVIGFIRLLGQDAGWYDTRFGIALNAGALTVALIGIVWFTAREVHRSEQERHQLSRQLEAIFDNVPASLAMRDKDGRFIRANAAVARARGADAKHMVGRPVTDFYPPDVAQDLLDEDASVYATGEAIRFDYAVSNAAGVPEEYEVTRFPVVDEFGELMGVGTFAIDVSDRKRAEREAVLSAERFRALLDAAPDATVIVDGDGVIAYVNARASDLLGYRSDELLGQHVELLVPDESKPRHEGLRRGYVEQASYRPMAATLDLTARHKDGHGIPVEISLGPLETHEGMMTSASIRDVTAKRRAADELRAAEQLFRSSFDDAPIGMALVATSGRIEQANPSLAELVGYDRNTLIGMPLVDLIARSNLHLFEAAFASLMRGGAERLALDLRLNTLSGNAAEVDLRASLLRDEAGQPTRLLVQLQDVTDRKRIEEQLQFMADHDPLTGLYNRRKFENDLAEHVARAKRYGPEGAIIALDIDHFKQVNDTLGHNVGDRLIVEIAGLLRSRLRESDIVARLGGDEFAILLPRATREEAALVADSIVRSISQSTDLVAGQLRKITTSAGVAMFDAHPLDELTGERVMIDADVALYDAKDAGRNTYAFHAEPDNGLTHAGRGF